MAAHPVFVVGSPRSGTSILASALQNAGYFGYNEGNFLPLIRLVERQVDRFFQAQGSTHPRVLTTHVDRAELVARLTAVIAETAESKQQRRPWFDKSGSVPMLEAMPALQRHWPGARFVFARRRGIENVVSRVLKFPRHDFAYHCTAWAETMAAWRSVRAANPGLPGLEIDQRDIDGQPDAVADRIATFLDLGEEPRARMAATFTRACGGEMAAYGYTTDAAYRSDSPNA